MRNNGTYASRRSRDERVEKNMQHHLDLLYKENGINTSRVTDVILQKRGVDLFYTDDGKRYYADEKSASTYAYKRLDTFAFELGCAINKDAGGWFCQDNYYLTQYYFIAYPYAPDNRDELRTLEDLEVIIISKKDMWDYLKTQGFDSAEDILTAFEEKGRVVFRNGKETRRWTISNDLKVVQSLYINPEQPINIIFSKELLKELAKKIFYKKF